jgi:hypothetical protein
MTEYVETCRPYIYNILHEINVVLLTDLLFLFARYKHFGMENLNVQD